MAPATVTATTTTTVPLQQQQQQQQQQHHQQEQSNFAAPRAEATTQARPAPESTLQSSTTSQQWSEPQTTTRTEVARAYVVQERVAVPVVLTTTTEEEVQPQPPQQEEVKKLLQGKVALVTGATTGIGYATAKLFRDEGATVVVTAKCEESCGKEQCEHVEGFDVVVTDVSSMSDLNHLMEHIQQKYGGLDILFANAGMALFKPTNEVDEEFFDALTSVNFKGCYFTVSKALPIMRTGSSIILNASNTSKIGWPGGSIYAATKAAVRSLARTWTLEIPPSKARVNVLSPGAVETRLLDQLGKTREEARQVQAAMQQKIPAGRFASPDEIARIALFLAGPDSSYVCGEELVCDGGWTAT